MQNFMNKIKGTLRGLNNKIKSNKDKIEKNKTQIGEIKNLRQGKVGRVNLNDKKTIDLVNEKKESWTGKQKVTQRKSRL